MALPVMVRAKTSLLADTNPPKASPSAGVAVKVWDMAGVAVGVGLAVLVGEVVLVNVGVGEFVND